eukprot:TRINITY_DN7503_c0_g1_i2.p1 TRINITY_DN7503_c0_g1~~TRINITY_DN7503_c0_g1_i2.p1  ORF type:complete len:637 (-),score=115.32 TRINITY_DN7503_c0_g1_i2:236-2146(-)
MRSNGPSTQALTYSGGFFGTPPGSRLECLIGSGPGRSSSASSLARRPRYPAVAVTEGRPEAKAVAARRKAAKYRIEERYPASIEATLRRRAEQQHGLQQSPADKSMLKRSLTESMPMLPAPASQSRRLPSEMVPRIQERGWIDVGSVGSVWAAQARSLARERLAASDPGLHVEGSDHLLKERLELIARLEHDNVSQGVSALRAALRMRAGSDDQAIECLKGVLGLKGQLCGQGLSVLELTGALSLLGLDSQALCGFGERELFVRSGGDKVTGRVTAELVCRGGDTAPVPALMADAVTDTSASCLEDRLLERWTLIAKFIALTAWFYTPKELRRRGRLAACPQERWAQLQAMPSGEAADVFLTQPIGLPESKVDHRQATGLDAMSDALDAAMQGHRQAAGVARDALDAAMEGVTVATRIAKTNPTAELHDFRKHVLNFQAMPSKHPSAQELAAADRTVVALAAQPRSVGASTGHPDPDRQWLLDSVRRTWAPNKVDFEKVVATMREHFLAHANVRQLGVQLMGRSDLCRFVGERPPVDLLPLGVAGSRHLGLTEVGQIYDDALQMQLKRPSTSGGRMAALTAGLDFDHFRMALLRIAEAVGLHFGHLVDDALDALDSRRAPVDAVAMARTMALSSPE